MINKKSRLSTIERKYCSCLAKVREQIPNPYGICTNSVYKTRGKKRTKIVNCFGNYDFSKFSKNQLLKYKSNITNKKKKGIINRALKKLDYGISKKLISELKKKLYSKK